MKLSTAALAAPLLFSTCINAFVAQGQSRAFSTTSLYSLQTGPSGKPASTNDEDLELTRQIIFAHIAGTDGASAPAEETPAETEDVVYATPAAPENDLMIRTALGREPVERTPVWLFRQAGRHLPEYHAYKAEKGRSFLDMLEYPEDVAECTLQPLRRYPMDAAILFSDILVIAQALNIEVTMPGGVGILVPNPLAGPEEVATRVPTLDEITPEFINDKLGVVLDSVKLIRKKMAEENISVPLIGFSGAPFTLMFYMIGGSSRKNKEAGMQWLNDHPEESRTLLDTLTKIIIEYMSAQVQSGAHMLQLFEAMGMMLEKKEFEEFALPCLEKIGTELKSRYPDVPVMVFSRGAWYVSHIYCLIWFQI
jgi:uroporphyrinogen decarboxylase